MSRRATSPLSYCAALVRDEARLRYVATLFAPANARPALFGLYAFDHEISKVRRVVSEPMAGLIRLQWWRDALEAISAGRKAPAHPVAEALQDGWSRLEASRARLDAAIDARERELEQRAPETLAELEQHLATTSSGLVLAALELLGVDDLQACEAGHRIGLAIGLADLLREVDVDRQRTVFLPADLLNRHKISPTALREATSPRAFAPAARELADAAREHLRSARGLRRAVPARALPALLPGSLVSRQLDNLRSLDAGASALWDKPLAPLWLLGYRVLGMF